MSSWSKPLGAAHLVLSFCPWHLSTCRLLQRIPPNTLQFPSNQWPWREHQSLDCTTCGSGGGDDKATCSQWHLSLSHVSWGCLDWFTLWLFTTSDFTSAQRLQSSPSIDWLTHCGRADVAICYHRCGWVTPGLHSLTSKVCGTPKSSWIIIWSMIGFCK